MPAQHAALSLFPLLFRVTDIPATKWAKHKEPTLHSVCASSHLSSLGSLLHGHNISIYNSSRDDISSSSYSIFGTVRIYRKKAYAVCSREKLDPVKFRKKKGHNYWPASRAI
jgi:hypothetical protein